MSAFQLYGLCIFILTLFTKTVISKEDYALNNLPRSAFTASSYKNGSEPYKVILNRAFKDNSKNQSASVAWCPKSKIGTDKKEWIQVDFGKLKAFKALLMQGLSKGNDGVFVSQFYLEYKRDNSSNWHRAFKKVNPRPEQDQLITGNNDARNTEIIELQTFIARIIRIIPYEHNIHVCLKFNILTNIYVPDGVIEYEMIQGDVFKNRDGTQSAYIDWTYDGKKKTVPRTNSSNKIPRELLFGGIGLLSDGHSKKSNLVGWSKKLQETNSIKILFKFDQMRLFKKIRLYMSNNFYQNISVFSRIIVHASVDGKEFSKYSKPTHYNYTYDDKLVSNRWVDVTILQKTYGQYISIEMFFHKDRILLSEIKFISEPSLLPFTIPSPSTTDPSNILKKKASPSIFQSIYLYILIFICIVIFLFTCVGLCLLRVRNGQQRTRLKSAITHPSVNTAPSNNTITLNGGGPATIHPQILYGNMIPTGTMTNNNTTVDGYISVPNGNKTMGLHEDLQQQQIYKPVPNGVYDCMIPYQSQTFCIRKGHTAPHQYFGTLKSSVTQTSSPNPNNICNSNYNNSAVMSPLLAGHNTVDGGYLYPVENKRASYDGSYGTGSNGDYSTTSMTTVPTGIINIPNGTIVNNPYPTTIAVSSNGTIPTNHTVPTSMFYSFSPLVNNGMVPPVTSVTNVLNANVSPGYDVVPGISIQQQLPLPPIQNIGQFNNGINGGHFDDIADQSVSSWSEQIQMIIQYHKNNSVPLESPVGGSLIVRQSLLSSNNLNLRPIRESEQLIMENATLLDKEGLDIQSCIGQGQLGKTYKAKYKGSSVIVKALEISCDEISRRHFLQSIADLLHISCNNLTKVIGYCKYTSSSSSSASSIDPDENEVSCPIINYVLTEDTKYTDLCTFIQGHNHYEMPPSSTSLNGENGRYDPSNSIDDYDEAGSRINLSQSCLVYIGTQISDGMAVLEQEGLLHRDLAARNCLLGPRLSVLITDTAMTNPSFADDYTALEHGDSSDQKSSRLLLPLRWMSPEAALWANYSIGSDVWSFGVVLWEILTGCTRRPYDTIQDSIDDGGASGVLMNHMTLLSHQSETALLPSNELLGHTAKHSQGPFPQPPPNVLPPPPPPPIQPPPQHTMLINREIRDLIHSCWSIEVDCRPKFRDISTFLRQKISGFNADEEYQTIRMKSNNSNNNNSNNKFIQNTNSNNNMIPSC